MVPRENKNNAYAKIWKAKKEYYGIFENGLLENLKDNVTWWTKTKHLSYNRPLLQTTT